LNGGIGWIVLVVSQALKRKIKAKGRSRGNLFLVSIFTFDDKGERPERRKIIAFTVRFPYSAKRMIKAKGRSGGRLFVFFSLERVNIV